jgi:endonuclease YncB( thermonuclease family)
MLLVTAASGATVQVGCAPQAAEITGRVSKWIDGDSFEIGGHPVRLFGIDAPEGRQDCRRNGQTWRCGDEARDKLRGLVADATLRCTPRDTDEYGRSVSVCKNGNVDINAEMVRAGFALAYRRYSSDYVDEENEARNAKRGLWSGEFTKPWDYRRDARESPTQTPRGPAPEATGPKAPGKARDSNCRIKGNISASGERIYHTPDSPSYQDTVIDERAGERWFCSEAEARAAGWRAAHPRNTR